MEIKPKHNRKIIQLKKEEAYQIKKGLFGKTKKRIIKDKKGNVQYFRHDFTGLMLLLDRFRSALHDINDLKTWVKVKNRLRKAYFEEKNELELTSDEVNFLKDYLENFQKRDGKDVNLQEFESKTLIGVLEQLKAE